VSTDVLSLRVLLFLRHSDFPWNIQLGCKTFPPCIYIYIYTYICIYIQDVPGGMCQTSGGCSLC